MQGAGEDRMIEAIGLNWVLGFGVQGLGLV